MVIWNFVRKIIRRLKRKGKKSPPRRRVFRRSRKKLSSRVTSRKREKPLPRRKPLKKISQKARRKKARKKNTGKKKTRPPVRSAASKQKRSRPGKTALKNNHPKKSKDKEIGTVTHYFDRIGVAAIKLRRTVKIGDTIRFAAGRGDFSQMVSSLQVDRKDILKASSGQEVGLRVIKPVRANDKVYLLLES